MLLVQKTRVMKGRTVNPFSLSVIIPTKFRPDDIEQTVKTIFGQTVPPTQVIVIDQSDSDENRRRVEKLYANLVGELRSNIKLSYIHDTSIVGPIIARNRGMDVAEGGIWAFFDDDVSLEPEYLQEVQAVYARYPAVAGVSGIFTNYQPPSYFRRVWNLIFACGPFHDERQPLYWRAERLRNSPPVVVKKFTGACMSFRAEAVRHIRFDENLPTTMEEDIDLCLRVGGPLVIAPRARLFHKRSSPGRSTQHYLKWEARTSHHLYRKYWSHELYNRFCFWWLNFGYALMATLGSLKRASAEPWQAFSEGAAEGKRIARLSAPGRKPLGAPNPLTEPHSTIDRYPDS
jgi:GT2 family glycosyltransferase